MIFRNTKTQNSSYLVTALDAPIYQSKIFLLWKMFSFTSSSILCRVDTSNVPKNATIASATIVSSRKWSLHVPHLIVLNSSIDVSVESLLLVEDFKKDSLILFPALETS